VEANIVLVAPTASGLRIGTVPTSGSGQGVQVLPNNVIPFDIAKNPGSLVNWGDPTNSKLLTGLTLSVTRQNTVALSAIVTPGSTKVTDVVEPSGSVVYTVLKAQYPGASFVGKKIGSTTIPDNTEIELVFAENITTYFNTVQQTLLP
jgi:hypothetical protein